MEVLTSEDKHVDSGLLRYRPAQTKTRAPCDFARDGKVDCVNRICGTFTSASTATQCTTRVEVHERMMH